MEGKKGKRGIKKEEEGEEEEGGGEGKGKKEGASVSMLKYRSIDRSVFVESSVFGL